MTQEQKQSIINSYNVARRDEAYACERLDAAKTAKTFDKYSSTQSFALGTMHGIHLVLLACGFELITDDEDNAVDIVHAE